MSDSKKDSQESSSNKEKNNDESKTMTQSIPTGSSGAHYATEPIQFRVRGSTVTGASPPKFVSLEEIMKAAHGFQNMALAHEIAVDQEFKLEPFEPPDNSYQKLVKETLHKAYFDILREQLNADPPEYKQAMVLLEDVKQGLFSILLPRHTRIKDMIEEVLDADFIKNQAENNALDFQKYATFVIDLMSKLAAPARDEVIQNITKMTDTVEIFRAILETLEVLKLDLANTLIAMIRPHVQAESVQYERAKFDEMLKVQEDGLEHTKQWLARHLDTEGLTLPVTDEAALRNVTAQTLAKAYLELLEWDAAEEYPETVALDAPRFAELGAQVFRLVGVASVLLCGPASAALDADAAAQLKRDLKDRLFIIIGDVSDDGELRAALPAAAEEVAASAERLMRALEAAAPAGAGAGAGAGAAGAALAPEERAALREHVAALADPAHRVRSLVRRRVLEFLREVLVCGGGARPVPGGLSALAPELTALAGGLLRCVLHNKAVFADRYRALVEGLLRE